MHRTRRTNPWSGQGQLPRIAYSLRDVCRLVPGSPAKPYVGGEGLILKPRREAFKRLGRALQRFCRARILAWRGSGAQLVHFVGEE